MPFKGYPEEKVSTDISTQQRYYVAKSNELVQQSRFSMTTQQSKIMLFLISHIRPDDNGSETYTFSISEFCKVCNIDDGGRSYTNVKRTIKEVADKSVWVKQPDGDEILLRWLSKIKINNTTKSLEVSFHEDMLPYLYALQNRFVSYRLDNILLMSSKYAIRLYEILKSYQYTKDCMSFEIDELKILLDATNYKRYPDFRRFVLDTAVNEINQFGDIDIDYIATTTGRSVSYITFEIKKPKPIDDQLRKKRKRKELSPEEKAKRLQRMKTKN